MIKKLFYIICLLFLPAFCYALDIIPGLKGFGTDTRAAYGATNSPEICIVDDLTINTGNPSWDAGSYSVGVFKGSLKQCVEGLDTLDGETIDGHVVSANSGKIILFEVSGTITQTGTNDTTDFMYDVGSYTSIYGQTSPEPGMLFRNLTFKVVDAHDILFQHLRGRMDGPPSSNFNLHKSFYVTATTGASAYNVIYDHISASWGGDGNISLYGRYSATQYGPFTVSNSILAECRQQLGLADNDAAGCKNLNIADATNVFLYGNLLSNSYLRNPRVDTGSVFVANNYIYNNYSLSIQIDGADGDQTVAFIGNTVDAGPMSTSNAEKFITFLGTWETPLSDHHIYLYDNVTDSGTQSSSTDWFSPGFEVDIREGQTANIYADMVDPGTDKYIQDTGETPSSDSPLWPTDFSEMASTAVKTYVIANAGAYPSFRDSVDSRLITEMTDGTGPSSTVTGVPGSCDWPTLTENTRTLSIPANPHTDSGDGYTNLEKWVQAYAYEVENFVITNALPADDATGVAVGVTVTWTNPTAATSVTVYFDTNNPPTTQRSTGSLATSYNPASDLPVSTEHFYRVDVVHADGTETGDVYSFTTAAGPPVDLTKQGAMKYSPGGEIVKYSSGGMVIK